MSAPTRTEPAVVVRDVSVRIDETPLLAPVSFTLGHGRALAVTGPNGSGKTTLLRVLAGVQAPSDGEVRVLGVAPDERSATFRADVAALLDPPPMSRSLVLAEYLALVGTSWGLDLDAAIDQAEELLAELGIAALTYRFPHELSSGQRQLYGLTLVLARPCSVLVLDEPEQRLDPDRLELVTRAIERRKATGTTLVVASHSAALVARLADDRLELDDARFLAER